MKSIQLNFSARPGRPSKRVAISHHFCHAHDSVREPKAPRCDLPSLPPLQAHLSSRIANDPEKNGKSLNVLQLLSLPPETIFRCLRLACQFVVNSVRVAVGGKINASVVCFTGIGEKSRSFLPLLPQFPLPPPVALSFGDA